MTATRRSDSATLRRAAEDARALAKGAKVCGDCGGKSFRKHGIWRICLTCRKAYSYAERRVE